MIIYYLHIQFQQFINIQIAWYDSYLQHNTLFLVLKVCGN